jgi:hypothetical protein
MHILNHVVETCCRRAGIVVLAYLVATVLLAFYTADNLTMDTDTERLFPNQLPWRQREIDLRRAFPQNGDLLAIVVDAQTPARAESFADELAQRLEARTDLFKSVRQPDNGFFKRNGLLYLSVDDLRAVTEQIAAVQPFLGTLASDPSLGTLFSVLSQALEAVNRGEIGAEQIEGPLAAVADSMESALAGKPEPLLWRTLVLGREPQADELRRFILAQPVLDYGALSPGGEASAFVRETARGLQGNPDYATRVRLTGSVALSDEEFATVAEGTGLAAVVSLTLVTAILFAAVRSVRIVLSILLTLVAGIIATSAFATATVGSINIISIGFVVLFIGIAVDFGIQFCVRCADERGRNAGLPGALVATAHSTGPSLALAATACAVGFLALVPTDYKGMAELGQISGVGMLIALILNLTLLPALLVLFRPKTRFSHVGFAWMSGVDRLLLRRRRAVIGVALLIAVLGIASAPLLRFDFDPLHVKNAGTESVATLYDLMGSETATPFTIELLANSRGAANALAERLGELPEVERVLTFDSFIPDEQALKLQMLEDLALITGPVASASPVNGAVDERTVESLTQARRRLLDTTADPALASIASRVANALGALLDDKRELLPVLQDVLLGDLPYEINNLALALAPRPVSAETLPESITREWTGTDGRIRLQVFPKGDIRDTRVRERFAAAVSAVAPDAAGAVISAIESGRTIVSAFVTAGWVALAVITVLLAVVLRRPTDVLLVLAPLLLAGLMTLSICVLGDLPLNFANIIALPLILGIGVSFAIYFVINWRNGQSMPLQSATTRAVLFSAITTGTAFGSLMLSSHPGTASMGALLSIALACTLASILFVLPALLGPSPRAGHGGITP